MNITAIFLVLIGSFVGALGTFVIKSGLDKYGSVRKFLPTYSCIIGFSIYALSVVSYIGALTMEELSIVYPFVSTTYIWTTLFSIKFLGEKMNKYKYSGLIGVVIGIILIGLGS